MKVLEQSWIQLCKRLLQGSFMQAWMTKSQRRVKSRCTTLWSNSCCTVMCTVSVHVVYCIYVLKMKETPTRWMDAFRHIDKVIAGSTRRWLIVSCQDSWQRCSTRILGGLTKINGIHDQKRTSSMKIPIVHVFGVSALSKWAAPGGCATVMGGDDGWYELRVEIIHVLYSVIQIFSSLNCKSHKKEHDTDQAQYNKFLHYTNIQWFSG